MKNLHKGTVYTVNATGEKYFVTTEEMKDCPSGWGVRGRAEGFNVKLKVYHTWCCRQQQGLFECQ